MSRILDCKSEDEGAIPSMASIVAEASKTQENGITEKSRKSFDYVPNSRKFVVHMRLREFVRYLPWITDRDWSVASYSLRARR